MNNYVLLGKMGEGAHGLVLRARAKNSGEVVALKKIVANKPVRRDVNQLELVLREILTLRELESQYIVQLLDVFAHQIFYVLVFEYMPSNLWDMLSDTELELSPAQIKSYMQMLLRGIAYIHEKNVMHRDLKPANLLIGEQGQLKIADFGLSRLKSDENDPTYTHQVATRWYRAPELLYGARRYNEGVDMWSVGCILGELLNSSPLFPGENDISQLSLVLQTLGTPTEDNWPGLTQLPDYNKISFPPKKAVPLEQVVPNASLEALDLLSRFLLYDSGQRISAPKALLHPYFFLDPLPATLRDMPKPPLVAPRKAAPNEYDVNHPWEDLVHKFEDLCV